MLQKLNEIQNKTYIDAVQIYDAYRDAYKAAFSYRGGMTWKKAKGKEYLFKIQDRFGNGKSLGARSAETEKIFEAFHSNKKKITKRFQQLTAKVKEQARFCKAAKIQRVPTITAKTLRELDQQNLLGNHMIRVRLFCIFKNFLDILLSFHSGSRNNHLMILNFLCLSADSEAVVAGTMPFSYRS